MFATPHMRVLAPPPAVGTAHRASSASNHGSMRRIDELLSARCRARLACSSLGRGRLRHLWQQTTRTGQAPPPAAGSTRKLDEFPGAGCRAGLACFSLARGGSRRLWSRGRALLTTTGTSSRIGKALRRRMSCRPSELLPRRAREAALHGRLLEARAVALGGGGGVLHCSRSWMQ
jgi:hypothetical protein